MGYSAELSFKITQEEVGKKGRNHVIKWIPTEVCCKKILRLVILYKITVYQYVVFYLSSSRSFCFLLEENIFFIKSLVLFYYP